VVVGALGPGSINPKAIDAHAPPPPEGCGTGAFCEIGADGVRIVADDIGHPNGIAFSPDGRTVYASDTLRRCVWRFTVDDNGWRDRKVFAQFDGALTDGMAVAIDGAVWLALALASEIVVIESGGHERTRIPTLAPLTTSVHFGGDDMRTALITSGSHSGHESATLLKLAVDVPGCIVPRARV
jgi:sugar lactone lactonase YvrE